MLLPPRPESLRARLRQDTHDAHARLDRRVSRFDLTAPEGLAAFLRMQLVALESLRPDAPHLSAELVATMRQALADDLDALGARPLPGPGATSVQDGTAMDYIVLGSRLGTNVLRKRWLHATDPRVRRARAYFSVPSAMPLWSAFCDATGGMSARGAAADRTVTSARAIFDIYADAARSERVPV